MSAEKKPKGQVRYRPASQGAGERCGNCVMFSLVQRSKTIGSCSLVSGVIDPEYVCDRWEPKR